MCKVRASARAKLDPPQLSILSVLKLVGSVILATVGGLALQWVTEWIIAS
ncbi:MAG: hypothetical protein H8F28_01325 [Fibrella sp.]|nr:hypothetical protein [Armatimonadota bacterium]